MTTKVLLDFLISLFPTFIFNNINTDRLLVTVVNIKKKAFRIVLNICIAVCIEVISTNHSVLHVHHVICNQQGGWMIFLPTVMAAMTGDTKTDIMTPLATVR